METKTKALVFDTAVGSNTHSHTHTRTHAGARTRKHRERERERERERMVAVKIYGSGLQTFRTYLLPFHLSFGERHRDKTAAEKNRERHSQRESRKVKVQYSQDLLGILKEENSQ